mmetsp:Transcript_46/g.118  ORF Transcript_46/g.118 Transcript_46/m.118 type:complete len:83 (-) Transcript_46:146-394(-)
MRVVLGTVENENAKKTEVLVIANGIITIAASHACMMDDMVVPVEPMLEYRFRRGRWPRSRQRLRWVFLIFDEIIMKVSTKSV